MWWFCTVDAIAVLAGDHVVVDVNYFPSFKEVPAAPSKLRIAVLQALSEVVNNQE